MAEALKEPETVQSQLPDSSEQLRRLHDEVVDLESQRDALATDLEEAETALERRDDRIEELETQVRGLELERDVLEAELESLEAELTERETEVDRLRERTADPESGADEESTIIQPEVDAVELGYTDSGSDADDAEDGADDGWVVVDDHQQLSEALELPGVSERLERASADSRCSLETAREVVTILACDGPMRTEALAERVDRSPVAVQSLLSELRTESLLDRPDERAYAVAADVLEPLAGKRPEE